MADPKDAKKNEQAHLVLADGTVFEGVAFGARAPGGQGERGVAWPPVRRGGGGVRTRGAAFAPGCWGGAEAAAAFRVVTCRGLARRCR